MEIDRERWSGDGAFTAALLDALAAAARAGQALVHVRVEDAPASRSDADFHFVSNEVFVTFARRSREERVRWFGPFTRTRTVSESAMTMEALEGWLTGRPDIGAPDYADAGMLQYLRTERVVPPYQTRGYKLVELVRIYEAGAGG